MVIFLQRTFTSLVNTHAGRTQGIHLPADAKGMVGDARCYIFKLVAFIDTNSGQ